MNIEKYERQPGFVLLLINANKRAAWLS